MKRFVLVTSLIVVFFAAPTFAESNPEAVVERQSKIIELIAEIAKVNQELHAYVQEAIADGELSEEESARIDELTAKLEELKEELEALQSSEDDGGAKEAKEIKSPWQLYALIGKATTFVYVSSPEVDPAFADFLERVHGALLLRQAHLGVLGFMSMAYVDYAKRRYPVLPGVVVATNEGGWPRPGFITPKMFPTPLALVQAGTPSPIVAVLPQELPTPPVVVLDRIEPSIEWKTINFTVSIAGVKVTLPIPSAAVHKVEHKVYLIQSPLVANPYSPDFGSVTTMKFEDAKKFLGPFLDAVFR